MLSINISETIWAIICFFILYFVLNKLLFKPLLAFMEERKTRIAAAAAESEELSAEMKKLEGAADVIISTARNEASAIIADGEAADAEALAEARRQARTELAALKAEKQEEISQSIKNNCDELTARKTELAAAVADQVLNL